MSSAVRSYRIINNIFAGIVVVIIIYSGLFSPVTNNYPVSCVHEQITGMSCPSCGLSHSFSYILRGEIREAVKWNDYGPRVFLFFIFQLVLRVSNTISLYRFPGEWKKILYADISLSLISFVLGFSQFVVYNLKLIF